MFGKDLALNGGKEYDKVTTDLQADRIDILATTSYIPEKNDRAARMHLIRKSAVRMALIHSRTDANLWEVMYTSAWNSMWCHCRSVSLQNGRETKYWYKTYGCTYLNIWMQSMGMSCWQIVEDA